MSSMPAVGKHSSNTACTLLNNTIRYRNIIIIHPDPVLPTIPPLQHSLPHYLKISPHSMLAAMCDVSVSDPVPLSMSSSPAVWSVPPHLHLIVTTYHDQYSPRTRCLSESVPNLHMHTSPPALSTSSSQLILSRNTTSVQFVFISKPVGLSVSSLFYISPHHWHCHPSVILPVLNSDVM